MMAHRTVNIVDAAFTKARALCSNILVAVDSLSISPTIDKARDESFELYRCAACLLRVLSSARAALSKPVHARALFFTITSRERQVPGPTGDVNEGRQTFRKLASLLMYY
jgi:hypothetical protein